MATIKTFVQDELTVHIYPTEASMGENAAVWISARIQEVLAQKGEANMMFGAAPSQSRMLDALVADPAIDWSRINAFHMDEYIGLAADAPQGFGNFLDAALFKRVAFKSVNYLNGQAKDAQAECDRYSALLKANPLDIVCLGVGENGHIAFNDPHVADFKDAHAVKIVELDGACRQQQVNDGCFKALENVPTHAMTVTVPALMAATHTICVAPFTRKAQAVYNTIYAPVNEKVPATILRTKKDAQMFVDKDSASLVLEK